MCHKLSLALVILLMALLAGWAALPALAQERQPATPTIIPGKPLPGSLELAAPAPGSALELSRAQPPAAQESPDYVNWHRLVYQSYHDGNWEIYMQGDSNLRLTYEGAVDARPRLNHSVTRVVFDSSRKDGYEIRRAALQFKLPYATTIAGAMAMGRAIAALAQKDISVRTIQSYHQ